MRKYGAALLVSAAFCIIGGEASADESVLGYIKGAETLPDGAKEFDQAITLREDKGTGRYTAWNTLGEIEFGVTDRFTLGGYLKMQSLDTDGLSIDGYLPGARKDGLRLSGVEVSAKYNWLSPAKDDFGLAGYSSLSYDWIDPHSGQDKDTLSAEFRLLGQKYYMEGQLVWLSNAGIEATYAKRAPIANLPVNFEWPTDPEMEIELFLGTGLTYRFAPKWFVGGEVLYETEFETEVGQERWSFFAGPSLHYANARFWSTLTWFPQLSGGGETYPGQPANLHLIEKTRNEFRLRFGIPF
jgi:hypothetical protein